MTKAEVKSYQSEHMITMYGKGRKTFKPLRTFKELGLSEAIMKVTAGFKAPTPEKKFYSMSAETEAMTKAEVKSYQSEHMITMYGKGRKTFKPLSTFKELGLSEDIMKVPAGFKAPTP